MISSMVLPCSNHSNVAGHMTELGLLGRKQVQAWHPFACQCDLVSSVLMVRYVLTCCVVDGWNKVSVMVFCAMLVCRKKRGVCELCISGLL